MINMSKKTWNKKRKLKERKIKQALKWAADPARQPYTKRALLAGPWKGLTAGTAVRFLKEMRDRGNIVMHGSTRKADYTLLDGNEHRYQREGAEVAAAAAAAVFAPEVAAPTQEEATVEEAPFVNAWIAARAQTGQKAVNIITLVDALLAGEAGLNALGEIKNQAVLILGDLELLEETGE